MLQQNLEDMPANIMTRQILQKAVQVMVVNCSKAHKHIEYWEKQTVWQELHMLREL